jgi:hypothetical protein
MRGWSGYTTTNVSRPDRTYRIKRRFQFETLGRVARQNHLICKVKRDKFLFKSFVYRDEN